MMIIFALLEQKSRLMTIKIRAKNLELDKNLKIFVQEKILALSRFSQAIDLVKIELTAHNSQRSGEIYTAEIQLREMRKNLIARETAIDIYSALNSAYDKISRQMRRLKKKIQEDGLKKQRKWTRKIKTSLPSAKILSREQFNRLYRGIPSIPKKVWLKLRRGK